MAKRIFYTYNTDTDNFERFFPSFKYKFFQYLKTFFIAIVLALILILVFRYFIGASSQEQLLSENKKLKSEYRVLSMRLDNMQDVVDRIASRDDNFYRVMMQMEPLGDAQRFANVNNTSYYRHLTNLSDSRLLDELLQRMNLLESKIYTQIQSFEQLKEGLENQKDKLAHIPAILPINIVDYTMSSGYGWRSDPIYGSAKFHEGLDFAASMGTEVFATADGVVQAAGYHPNGYGNRVDINHGYNYLTRYAHLSEIFVKEGEEVKRGQLIGKVGSTGKSTGPHLHYEVRIKDEPQNPVNYYFLDVTPEQYYAMIQMAENAGHVMD